MIKKLLLISILCFYPISAFAANDVRIKELQAEVQSIIEDATKHQEALNKANVRLLEIQGAIKELQRPNA